MHSLCRYTVNNELGPTSPTAFDDGKREAMLNVECARGRPSPTSYPVAAQQLAS